MKKINITVNLKNKQDLYNPYNNSILNDNLSSYLLNSLRGLGLKEKVRITIIHTEDISLEEQKNIENIIHTNFYRIDFEDAIHTKAYHIRAIILLIVGIILLWISYYLNTNNIYIIEELILILGWVAIWEVADYLLFEDTKNRIKSKRIDELTKATIKFVKEDN